MNINSTIDGLVFKNKVGNLDVLTNQTLHISKDNNVVIEFHDLTVEFTFTQDPEIKEARYEGTSEGKKMTISLINFSNSLGEGVLEPVSMGHMFERVLYFTFYVWTADKDKGLRRLNYSFYLGEKYNG